MNVGSLFSGIGGFDLGLERAGMRVVWQCEQDEFCRRVLALHWPGVPCYPDVRALVGNATSDLQHEKREGDAATRRGRREQSAGARADGSTGLLPVPVPPVDVLCGGFPCQDISLAGKGAGIDGARSGLWAEYARLVGELRPRYVIVENVSALLTRGLGRVVGDLAALGYDAEWDCLPASAFGAPHRRDRLWLVAYPGSEQHEGAGHANGRTAAKGLLEAAPGDVADANCEGRTRRRGRDAVDAQAHEDRQDSEPAESRGSERDVQDADERALLPWRVGGRVAQAGGTEWWAVEPPVGRVAHGVPDRLDQLAALGNALVPQIAEWLGRRIIEADRMRAAA